MIIMGSTPARMYPIKNFFRMDMDNIPRKKRPGYLILFRLPHYVLWGSRIFAGIP